MDKRELDKLMIKVARGDEAAFEILYAQTRRGIYAFIYSYLKNREDTEDVMQDVYIRVRQNAYRYKAGTDARAWMFQIAKNLALNALKQRNRFAPLEWAEKPVHTRLRGELLDVMERVLDEEEYRIIVLHVLWGYKHREIAERLSLPTGTVTSKYKRAVDKIKREWEDDNA